MSKHWMLTALVVTIVAVAGCGSLGSLLDVLQPSVTRVQLVNDGDYAVEVELVYGGDQNALESILTSLGEKVEVTVQAGQTYSFSVDCEELQAIVIENAALQVLGGIGPETDTDVYRDGDDFGCGDTLTFRFDNPTLPTAISVTFSSQ